MSGWDNNFGTDTFEGVMKKLFKDYPQNNLKFFNRKVTRAFGGVKVAEMVLSTKGTSGHYERIVVSIIHKDTGVIASESFNFCDYLMEGWKKAGTDSNPLIIDHCGTDWYMNGPTPKAIKHLMERIADYVALYE